VCDGQQARPLGYHVGSVTGDNLPAPVEVGMPIIVPWQKIETEAKSLRPEASTVTLEASAVWI
jgi:hypothetical protein